MMKQTKKKVQKVDFDEYEAVKFPVLRRSEEAGAEIAAVICCRGSVLSCCLRADPQ